MKNGLEYATSTALILVSIPAYFCGLHLASEAMKFGVGQR